MTDSLDPALTKNQWAAIQGDDVTITPAQWPYNREFWKKLFLKHPFEWGESHGLAALCLYNQPYGFTREDIYWLKGFHFSGPTDPRHTALIAKITALLPPE